MLSMLPMMDIAIPLAEDDDAEYVANDGYCHTSG